MNFLEWTYQDNTLQRWFVALIVFLSVLVILRVLRGVLARRLTLLSERTETHIDDLIASLVGKTKFLFLVIVSLYAASRTLTISAQLESVLKVVIILTVFYQVGIWASGILAYAISRYMELEVGKEAASAGSITTLTFIGRVALWSVLLMLALENLDVDITALVTGLGIGGIAVALAAQNILGDLFASLSILLDRPFVVGDFIIVDDLLGSVEKIGLKTTRVRSLIGEQLIFSNADLLSSRIRNFKRMLTRRIAFTIGVIYQTPYQKVAAIPSMIREIVQSETEVRFDRAHFKEYGDSSLNFEIVYYVSSPNYNQFMDIQQRINLEIFRRFEEEGIEFAYPTRTLYVTHENSLPGVAENLERAKGTEPAQGPTGG